MAEFKNLITLTRVSDGAPGTPGAPGTDAQKYKIETNRDEILRSYSEENLTGTELSVIFSPSILEISLYKIEPTNTSGEIQQDIDSSTFSFSIYNDGWKNLDLNEDFFEVVPKILKINFDNLKKYAENNSESDTNDIKTNRELAKYLVQNEALLKITCKTSEEDKIYLTEKIVAVRNLMNLEMAKLSLKAAGIYASIAKSKLEFSENGLIIQNNGLKIKNKEGAEVFKANDNGDLFIIGEITATSGSFKGEITATSGSIGGFSIAENRLVSDDGESIVLYGSEGKIIAKNIELGIGATISEYIQLGDKVKILNPDKNSGNFLTVQDNNNQDSLTFKNNGNIILGDITTSCIEINGPDQTIYAYKNGDKLNPQWKINPEEAVFNNIVARGAIQAATFEYGVVQAIGGILLVRPSSKIRNFQTYTSEGKDFTIVYPETEFGGFEINDTCLIEAEGDNKIKNLIRDGGFENNNILENWEFRQNVAKIDKNIYKSGKGSLNLPKGDLSLAETTAVFKLEPKHKYYGRECIKTNGELTATDDRFELIYVKGDKQKSYVFGYNRGSYQDWTVISDIITADEEDASLDYRLRTFTVNGSADAWIDDIILVDLTASFGAGNEPNKKWCDENIEFTSNLEVNSKIYAKVTKVGSMNEYIEIDKKLDFSYIGSPIINLGQEGSVGIGINGSTNNAFLHSKAISVVEFDGIDKLNAKIILGELSSDYAGPAKGSYGLYAENVVLQGQLTTGKAGMKYSGIGTALYENGPTTETRIDRFPEASRGQILLWAGANSNSKQDIENSKFFVDEYGNMYAGSGYFDGTIITNSTIRASKIETLEIVGTDSYGNDAALTIKDVNKGIDFIKGNASVFSLSADKVDIKLPTIIDNALTITGVFEANSFKTKENLEISGTSIFKSTTSAVFSEDSIELKAAGESELKVSSAGVSIWENVYYLDSSNNIKTEYRQVKNGDNVIGYDLYIY